MRRTSWTNLNDSGRRVERINKLCETKIQTEMVKEHPDEDIILAYIDRLIKGESVKMKIVDLVLGISAARKLAEKALEQPKMYLR